MSFLCFHLSLIICPSPCVSKFICLQINLSPIMGLPWWCPAFRLFALDTVSSIICLSPSVSYFICFQTHLICLQSYVCLSGSVLFEFHLNCIRVSCFSLFLKPFVSPCCLKINSCSAMVFMRFTTCVPLVSYLVSLSLSQIQMLRQRIDTVWYEKMLLVIHGVLN